MDGVMNHSLSFRNCDVDPIDPDCVANLDRILHRTHADVVISSSWRLLRSHADIADSLRSAGLIHHGRIISSTPFLNRGCRGDEITMWIEDNRAWDRRVAILDDDPDPVMEAFPGFHRTRFHAGGLTEQIADSVIGYLLAPSELSP